MPARSGLARAVPGVDARVLGHAVHHGGVRAVFAQHDPVVGHEIRAPAHAVQGQGALAHARESGHGQPAPAQGHSGGVAQEPPAVEHALDEAVVDEVDDLVGVVQAGPHGQVVAPAEYEGHARQALVHDASALYVGPLLLDLGLAGVGLLDGVASAQVRGRGLVDRDQDVGRGGGVEELVEIAAELVAQALMARAHFDDAVAHGEEQGVGRWDEAADVGRQRLARQGGIVHRTFSMT